ncbi:MAG: hypothetical protein JWM73_3099, partial [Solirubrobacterales bacterium]|nr:hypothetical protein [Solirubrobacterales bacterium]
TTASAVYDPAHKPTLGDGERIRYFSTDLVGNAEAPHTSTAVRFATATPPPGGGVQPDNRFTSGRPAIAPGGGLVLRYGLPGAGRLEVILHHNRRPGPTPRRLLPGPGRVVPGRAERNAPRAGGQRLVIPLSRYGLRMIRRNGGHLRVVITEQFTPVGGTARTRSRTVRLRMRRGSPSAITIAGVSGGA